MACRGFMRFYGSRHSPWTSFDQSIRFRPAPRAGFVIREFWRRLFLPGFQNRRDEFPLGIDFFAAHEQQRNAFDRIEQQPLVRFRQAAVERLLVIEIHPHRLQREAHARAAW